MTSRRAVLAGTAALLAAPRISWADDGKPRVTVISQWAAGSDGDAISAFGKVFEQKGGVWQHSPVPGFTTEMMNKLRAQILAGDPPAASQLKGPEITAWSQIAPTLDLDPLVAEAGYEKVVAPDLAKLHKPGGHWAALPLQIYRINTLYASKAAMDKVGATKLPATWAEFNELAGKMAAAGIIPCANSGVRWDDGMKYEIALGGLSVDAYRKGIMDLDVDTLKGPVSVAAFRQLRKLADWMDPNIGTQSWVVNMARFFKGEIGMLMTGGWAQGNIAAGGYKTTDYMIGPAPNDNPKPFFILNADAFIFWKQKAADLQAGQKLMAQLAMTKDVQSMYSKITGSVPVRTDVDMSGEGWRDGQRETGKALVTAVADKQTVLSLAHNMAQSNQITAPMIDVLTEFVHNKDITAEKGAQRLADAADSAR